MKKICVFDLDGTLVNSLYDLADAMNYALVKNGFEPHEREKYRFMVGNGISSLADRAMVIPKGMATDEQKKQVLADFNEYYTKHSLDKTVPYDGITELLTKLDELSIKYAIMSNKPDKFTKSIAAKLFPDNKFAAAWGQQPDFERKPCPDALLAMLAELGFDKSDCLYIGDSNVDVQTAKNAEIDFCGVNWGFRPESELIAEGAEFIAKTADDILKRL